MEALCAAAAAALTVYDMVKRHDRGMELVSLRLVHKSGGRTGEWNRSGEELGIGTLVGAALTPPAQPQSSPTGNGNRAPGPDLTPARGSRKVNR
jgi:hypothetical protein